MPSRHKLVMMLLVLLAACTRVGAAPAAAPPEGAAEPPAEMTASSLAGIATLGGRRLRVALELAIDARGRGAGHLEIPDLSLTADGTAGWRGDTLELDLRYDGGCPGDLRIRARRSADGARVEGTLTAKDCTGEEAGTVVLEIRTPSNAPREQAPR